MLVPHVVIAGNPNTGKTTLFNALTGLRYKVANYPGVTVEKRQGEFQLPGLGTAVLVDLPGTYNLSGHSIDETIAARYLTGQIPEGSRSAIPATPDLVIAVLDGSNLERGLYLVTQLIDMGLPVIVALNMIDVAEKRGISVRQELLSRALGVPVVSLVASRKEGIQQLITEVAAVLGRSNDQKRSSLPVNLDIEAERIDAEARYRRIESVLRKSVVYTDGIAKDRTANIDRVLTHPVWGTLIFFAIMGTIFQSIFTFARIPMEFLDLVMKSFGNFLSLHLPDGVFRSLLVDGVVAGVGSVLIFIPQIAILYTFIGILEDSGYLCRAAFLMDRVMRKVGLQGRSFIPLLSSFACAIPGIMSTRVIPSVADRLATILIAPLMSCSARLPVYTLLIAAFVPDKELLGVLSLQGLVLLGLYLLGICGAAVVSLLLKLTILRGQPSHLVMEMPPYHLPSLILAIRNAWDRIVVFVRDAGTTILACSILLWFLASYPRQLSADGVSAPPPLPESYAGQLGTAMQPVLRPLGFDWRIGVGILASFAAREVFVSSMATVYNLENSSNKSETLQTALRETKSGATGEPYGLPVALSLMVFFCFACQCMSTLAVCRRETGSWK